MPHARLLSTAAARLGRRGPERRLPAAQLPVVVEILAAHVRAGRSLRQALADAAADLSEPAAGRVAAAAADTALGAPAADALGALGQDADVAYLAAAVRLHTRSGGDLALLLERTAELLHERAAQRRAAEVATAQARATGRIVTAMPALGVAALFVADRPGFDLLVRSPLGWLALLTSAGMAALGHALIVRLSEVDP
jgi:tight adherence protein B